MVEDKSTITINDETSNTEETNKTSKIGGTDVTSKIEGTNVTSKIEGANVTSTQEVSTENINTEEASKTEGTITSDESGVAIETEESTTLDAIRENAAEDKSEAEKSTTNDAMQENNNESVDKSAPIPKPAKAPVNTLNETDDAELWDDEAPVTENDLINELFYHGGMAKNVAKEMIEKLKAATDTELKEAMINHIAWHIATGGPKNKENGGEGKASHKKDILDYLKTL